MTQTFARKLQRVKRKKGKKNLHILDYIVPLWQSLRLVIYVLSIGGMWIFNQLTIWYQIFVVVTGFKINFWVKTIIYNDFCFDLSVCVQDSDDLLRSAFQGRLEWQMEMTRHVYSNLNMNPCFVFFTYVDGCYGDHVGAVKLQPHLLHGLPELSAALRALPVHLQDIQAGGEHLGLVLDSTEPRVHRTIYHCHTDLHKQMVPRWWWGLCSLCPSPASPGWCRSLWGSLDWSCWPEDSACASRPCLNTEKKRCWTSAWTLQTWRPCLNAIPHSRLLDFVQD